MSRIVVGFLVVAIVAGAFVLMRYASLLTFGAWKDISKFNRDVLDAARKQREQKPD